MQILTIFVSFRIIDVTIFGDNSYLVDKSHCQLQIIITVTQTNNKHLSLSRGWLPITC